MKIVMKTPPNYAALHTSPSRQGRLTLIDADHVPPCGVLASGVYVWWEP